MTINWNRYRARYDAMTYAEVAAFHRVIWESYPEQAQHSTEHLAAFFSGLVSPSVVELGGWRGEAAGTMLARFPGIVLWDNYEICEPAARKPVTPDPRYHGIFPDRWPWELPTSRYDTAVLSHVIEHVRARQLRELADWLHRCGVEHLYVEAPLEDAARTWGSYEGAHVLELGMPEVVDLLSEYGFVVQSRAWHEPESHVLFLGAAA